MNLLCKNSQVVAEHAFVSGDVVTAEAGVGIFCQAKPRFPDISW